MRRILLTIAVALLAAPAAARAEEYTAQAGVVSAKLTWTAPAQDDAAPVFALTVQRAAAVGFDRPLRVKNCAGRYCRPAARFSGDAPLRVADLDGDGEPEVIVFAYWGGAHCCYLSYVLHFDAASGMPLQVWRFRAGRFVDVTRAFPGRIRKDARRWWRAYRSALRGHLRPVGVYGAVVPSGRRYVRQLDKRLRKLGYLRRLRG